MNGKPWIIYGQDGEAVAKLRVGSTRFGRAMRAAQEIKRYTQGKVFISHEDSMNPTFASRWYTTSPVTLEDQQARNRLQLNGAAERFAEQHGAGAVTMAGR